MLQNNSLILNFFSKYPNQPFEFVVVTDINIKEHPNYYKAIFRNIKTNNFYSVAISPEMMRYKYKIGHIYTNGEHTGQNKTIAKDEFTVNTSNNLQLSRLSSIIHEDEAKKIIDYKDVSKYLLRQFVHIEEQENCTLIVPCYCIANRFYFLSSSMKHAIMTATLDELYYPGSIHVEKNYFSGYTIKLHIKKKAGRKDLPFLCRFLVFKYTRNRLEYLANQKSLDAKLEYQPIKAQFPVQKSFNIYASYIYIGDDSRGLPKYLVLNIHSDNAPFGFDEIYYKQYSSKADPQEITPEEYPIPKPPKRKFKRKKPQRNNQVYTGTPSDEYIKYTLTTNEDDYFQNSIHVYGESIYLENESEPDINDSPAKIGNSFSKPSSDGDKNLGEVEQSNDEHDNNQEKKIFNLDNFYQFYEALLTFAFVEGNELVGPIDIKKIKNHKRKTLKSKSILNGEPNKARRFLYGKIYYDQKIIYIVEIEQDPSWGPSTWIFFTNEDSEPYNEGVFGDIIEYYIDNDLIYNTLAEYVRDNFDLSFVQKEHKKGDISDEDIERWGESVLKKLF